MLPEHLKISGPDAPLDLETFKCRWCNKAASSMREWKGEYKGQWYRAYVCSYCEENPCSWFNKD